MERAPLVGAPEPLAALRAEFADARFLEKIASLEAGVYVSLRRMRGDGNCFYRAVAYGLFEHLAAAGPDAAAAVRARAQAAYEGLLALGYPDSTTIDFYETVRRAAGALRGGTADTNRRGLFGAPRGGSSRTTSI